MMLIALLLVFELAAETPQTVDFDSQVVPLLTHAGCNAGACHGAAAGRGGFHLSLFGSDPAADYEAIVLFAEGRRVNLADSAKSLVLAKPLGMLEHGGDVVLQEDSTSVAMLRRWLDQGAPRGAKRQLVDLRVDPAAAMVATRDMPVTLRAIARFSDGAELDVTEWTVFRSDDTASVEILSEPPRALCHRPGKHLIMARFWNRIMPVSISLPYESKHDLKHSLGTTNSSNMVDVEIDSQLEKLNLVASVTADDSMFLRRLQLDLTGRLPTPEELHAFRSDANESKRRKKIDSMLDSPEFSKFWALRLARWLRLRGAPEEPQAVRAYGDWILNSLERRLPYNAMARELLNGIGDSHVFGAANFARTASDARQHAELVSSLFMGTRIQCANCHNHPFAQWTQDDYHGMAAVFAKFDRGRNVALKMQGSVTNIRTGESAIPRIPGVRNFNDAEPALPGFTAWLLNQDNPYFAKATVNRLWDAMMGQGLVAGVDDFRETNPPTHSQLLDKLAEDFVTNGYDLRQTLRTIASSNAYSRVSSLQKHKSDMDAWYVSALPKPLLPEVHLDAIDDVLTIPLQDHSQRRTRAIDWLDPMHPSAELDSLGRCSRGEACQSESKPDGLASKLHAINGNLLNQRISAKNGRLQKYLRDDMAPIAIVEDFYERALAKEPSEQQRSRWLSELSSMSRDEQARWLEDFVWAILSSNDFSTNR